MKYSKGLLEKLLDFDAELANDNASGIEDEDCALAVHDDIESSIAASQIIDRLIDVLKSTMIKNHTVAFESLINHLSSSTFMKIHLTNDPDNGPFTLKCVKSTPGHFYMNYLNIDTNPEIQSVIKVFNKFPDLKYIEDDSIAFRLYANARRKSFDFVKEIYAQLPRFSAYAFDNSGLIKSQLKSQIFDAFKEKGKRTESYRFYENNFIIDTVKCVYDAHPESNCPLTMLVSNSSMSNLETSSNPLAAQDSAYKMYSYIDVERLMDCLARMSRGQKIYVAFSTDRKGVLVFKSKSAYNSLFKEYIESPWLHRATQYRENNYMKFVNSNVTFVVKYGYSMDIEYSIPEKLANFSLY